MNIFKNYKYLKKYNLIILEKMKYFLNLFLLSLLISSINSTFQTDIFTEINKDKKGENLIISPLSIYQVLSLLANGANGETQSEMLSTLGSNTIDELNDINFKILSRSAIFTTIDIANAVMARYQPLDDFCSIAEKYLAPMETLKSVEQVNNWCSEKTHGKIEKIIEELSPETIMILLNAVYFKGEWISPFEKESNIKLPFYNLGKEKKILETMVQVEHFRYFENSDVQAIELPFREDFMSAIIILPSEKTDINKYIENKLNQNSNLNDIINNLEYAKVHLELPKFELEFSELLNDVMKKLGMKKIFISGEADLSGLYKNGDLFVSKIIHKTYLKVNEVGTEAAAITLVAIDEAIFEERKEIIHKMKVNRPFLFLLKNSRLPDGYNMVFISKIEKI